MPLMTELLDQHTVGVKDFGFSFNLSTSFCVTLSSWMRHHVQQCRPRQWARETWENCRPRKQKNNKLKSFIELTGTTKKPQNHTLFIVKRKMSSQKNMFQSWFLYCFRFTTQAQLPVQYMDSNGKHLCQSSGRKHMGIATHTRAHTHRHLLYNLCFAIPKEIMTAGIRFPQNNPGTKKWIVSLIFSKTSTSPQQLNDRHMYHHVLYLLIV